MKKLIIILSLLLFVGCMGGNTGVVLDPYSRDLTWRECGWFSCKDYGLKFRQGTWYIIHRDYTNGQYWMLFD